jgi:Fe-S oxidoreductase
VGREPAPGRCAAGLLWPDTFTNHFEPENGVAAIETLEAAGFAVVVPQGRLCCGRPLYDYGFLASARRYLEHTVDALRDEIRAGTPVVGLEPSCVAVFRDELTKMLPHDEDAKRLADQTFHIDEFLAAQEGYDPPRFEHDVVLQGHCHASATGGVEAEHELLRRMGAHVDEPDGGCCGMAGAWGYEAPTTRSRGPAASAGSCPPFASRPTTRSSSPTASRAATRSSRATRAGARFISRRC